MTAATNPPGALTPTQRTQVLVEALPYIRAFHGDIIVVKLGGNAMVDADLARRFAEDIVLLQSVGIRPVVVHGGGPQIGELLGRLNIPTEFVAGQRVTDAETLDVVRMVLVGKVNRDIVSSLNTYGPVAVGLSGEDAGLIGATPRDPALGFVGDVVSVNTAIVERLLAENLIPVVSTIGSDPSGQAYNINADAVAGALAGALGAAKVLYLTDVPGVLADPGDPSSLLAELTPSAIAELVASGVVDGGMVPKVEACVAALHRGAGAAHLLDGRVPHALLLEIFTDAGIGTMVVADPATGPIADGSHGQ